MAGGGGGGGARLDTPEDVGLEDDIREGGGGGGAASTEKKIYGRYVYYDQHSVIFFSCVLKFNWLSLFKDFYQHFVNKQLNNHFSPQYFLCHTFL